MILTKNKILLFLTLPLTIFCDTAAEEKILSLKQRLSSELILLEKKKAYIESLKKQISSLEFSQIKKRVVEFEKKVQSFASLPLSYQKEGANLFFKERKTLTERLDQDPDDLVAQNLLDRILRLITVLNRNPETE